MKVINPFIPPDPKAGLEMLWALTWFASEADANYAESYGRFRRRSTIKQNTPGSLTHDERSMMRSLRLLLEESLVTRLAMGELKARGRASGHLDLVAIPAEWWREVALDCDAHTATAGGTTLHAMRICETEEASPAETSGDALVDVSSSPQPASPGLERANVWMKENVTLEKKWKRTLALKQCRHDAECTSREAAAAWKSLSPELKGTRGRHKG